MKNIHILPAKNPQVSAKGQIYLATHDIPNTHYPIRLVRSKPNSTTSHRKECVRQELYITSDKEINVGNYYLCKLSMKPLKCIGDEYFNNVDENKIILTTDQELIADGIQAIPDEFLEWFVKNPSCEEVETKVSLEYKLDEFGNAFWGYNIIIPKEIDMLELGQIIPKRNKMKAQTAVEWLVNELIKNKFIAESGAFTNTLVEQAKEMEKKQQKFSEEEVEKLIKTTYEETMGAMVDWFINNKDKNQEEMESAIENYVYPKLSKKGIKFKNKKENEAIEMLDGLVLDVGNLLCDVADLDFEWQQAGYYETAKKWLLENKS